MGFRRSRSDRWWRGVCGGLAQSQGWNSNVVRMVAAVLAIAIPGVSLIPMLIIYVVLGYYLPESEEF